MNLRLTSHFKDRLVERDISFDHVKKAMKEPDIRVSAEEGKMRAIKKIGTKTIEVVYFKEGFRDKKDEYVLVTAYYL
jgi:hypothetical protein